MLVIDACVFVAAVDPAEPENSSSREFLSRCRDEDLLIAVPTLAPVEVACALARRSGNPDAATELTRTLFGDRRIIEHPIDAPVAHRAAQIGATLGLRSADACYAMLAIALDAPLITIDRELLKRAGGVTPQEWLAGGGRRSNTSS